MAASGSWDPFTSFGLTHIHNTYCTCNGFAPSKGRRCGWRLEISDINIARRILNDMAHQDPHGSEVQKTLPLLASLVLCQKHHQNQVPEQVSGFTRRLDNVSVISPRRKLEVYSDKEDSVSYGTPLPVANVLVEKSRATVNAKADQSKDEAKKPNQPSYESVLQLKQKADAEIASLRERFAELTSAKDDLKQQLKEARALHTEEKNKTKKLQAETDQLKKTVTKLEADAGLHASTRDEIGKLRSENAKLKQTNEAAKKSEAAMKKEMRDLEAQVNTMTITPPSSFDPDATLVGSPSVLVPTPSKPTVSTNANVTMTATNKGVTMTIKPMLNKMVGRMTRSRASKEQLA